MPSRPYLPASWRITHTNALALTAVINLSLFSWLALTTLRGTGLSRYDAQVTAWAVSLRTTPATLVMDGFSTLGSPLMLTILTVGCALALIWFGRRAQATVLALAMIGSTLATVLLKECFGRERPSIHLVVGTPAQSLSFPSGHSFNTAVFTGALAGFVLLSTAALAHKIWALLTAVATTALVGISRVYLGYHWMTDVLSGWCVGVAWLCLLALGALWLHRRRRSRV